MMTSVRELNPALPAACLKTLYLSRGFRKPKVHTALLDGESTSLFFKWDLLQKFPPPLLIINAFKCTRPLKLGNMNYKDFKPWILGGFHVFLSHLQP